MGIPIIAAAIQNAVASVLAQKLGSRLDKSVAAGVTASAVEEIVNKVTADPVVKNEMNAEPWWQSRVALGSIVAALGVVLPPVLSLFGIDTSADKIVEFGTALVTLGGALFALYGRLASGLKPLFSRKG